MASSSSGSPPITFATKSRISGEGHGDGLTDGALQLDCSFFCFNTISTTYNTFKDQSNLSPRIARSHIRQESPPALLTRTLSTTSADTAAAMQFESQPLSPSAFSFINTDMLLNDDEQQQQQQQGSSIDLFK